MANSTWLHDAFTARFRSTPWVSVHAWDGWQHAGDPDRAPDHLGVVDHHTGSAAGSSYLAVVRYCITNNLCNYLTGPDGDGGMRVDVIAAGRTWHAGVPDAEWDPHDAWAAGSMNTRAVGAEHFSTTAQTPWSDRELWVQMECDRVVLDRLAHRHIGPSSGYQADHKDWATGRKTDRHSIDTTKWRRDLQRLLDGGPNPYGTHSDDRTLAMFPIKFGTNDSIDVRRLQWRLVRLGHDLAVDGDYGNQTAQALQAEFDRDVPVELVTWLMWELIGVRLHAGRSLRLVRNALNRRDDTNDNGDESITRAELNDAIEAALEAARITID